MLKRAAVALLLALGASAAAHEEADSPRAEVPLRRAGGASFVKVADGAPVAPKVRVSASPGQPPALLLENLGREPVIVLGAHDEPFLRISASGVDGNLASPTFKATYTGLMKLFLDQIPQGA